MNGNPSKPLALALVLLALLWVGHRWQLNYLQAREVLPGTRALEGRVTYLLPTAGHGTLLSLKTEGRTVQVMLSPTLGHLDPMPRPDERYRIIAVGRGHKRKTYWHPVSRHHLIRLESLADRTDYREVLLEEAARLPKKTKVRVRASATEVNTFQSRAGKVHLKFTLTDRSRTSAAIMWQGTFSRSDRQRLGSGRELLIVALVDEYRGDLSLVVQSVEELP